MPADNSKATTCFLNLRRAGAAPRRSSQGARRDHPRLCGLAEQHLEDVDAVAAGERDMETLGDVSTLADPSVVKKIVAGAPDVE